MTRTKIKDRHLPEYTRGEEIFNTVTHIVGGGFGVIALIACVILSALHRDVWAVVGSAIYGGSMVMLYTVSSVYHALKPPFAKKIMQVIDHCTIYLLIAGTYTPILFCAIRKESQVWAWVLFGLVWGLGAMASVFTAIDLKKYAVLSMICYIGMGWCIVIAAPIAMRAIPRAGLLYLLWGGIAYTVGAIIYGFGKKCKYMHSIFHIFVVLGSVLQFFSIFFYII